MATQPEPGPDRIEPHAPPETPGIPDDPIPPAAPPETPGVQPDIDLPGSTPTEMP